MILNTNTLVTIKFASPRLPILLKLLIKVVVCHHFFGAIASFLGVEVLKTRIQSYFPLMQYKFRLHNGFNWWILSALFSLQSKRKCTQALSLAHS